MFWRLSHEKDKTRFLLQKDMKKIMPEKRNKTEQKGKHEEWVCFVQMYLLSLFVLQMNFKLMTCSLTRPRGRCWHFSLPKYWAWNMVSFKANLESHISSNYPLKDAIYTGGFYIICFLLIAGGYNKSKKIAEPMQGNNQLYPQFTFRNVK